jgi:hypothetical protein
MKQMSMVRALIVLAVVAVLPAACGSAPAAATGGMPLDTAIQEAAVQIAKRVETGTKIALLNFDSPADRFSEYVLNELEANLLDLGSQTIVDRKEIDLIREEFDFQMSGEVDDSSIQELGRMLGAQSIVTGSLVELGGSYRMVIRALSVQSAAVAAQYRNDIANDNRVQALLSGGKSAAAAKPVIAAGGISGSGGAAAVPASTADIPVPANAVPAAPATYKIGDTGPAGGIVFYDKGNNSGGWRYLEAAPADLGKAAQWQSAATEVNGTKNTIGSGKQNTQLIGESGRAALLCQQYSLGGFRDWFLPSKGELDLMYINLKMKDLGGFSDGWYWASTQISASPAWTHRFNAGDQEYSSHGSTYSDRAIRQF